MLATEPNKIHELPKCLHEPTARDLAFILVTAFALATDKAGREEVCLNILRFCNELAQHSPVYAGGVVNTVVGEKQGILPPLVTTARKFRGDPGVGPFLTMLKNRLLVGDGDDEYLRECQVKGDMWRGLSLEECEESLRRYHLHPDQQRIKRHRLHSPSRKARKHTGNSGV